MLINISFIHSFYKLFLVVRSTSKVNLMEEVKGYCSDSKEEEEEEEEEGADEKIIPITREGGQNSSRLQLEEEDARMNEERKQAEEVDLMELRLGGGRGSKSKSKSKSKEEDGIGGSSNSKEEEEEVLPVVVEKEHLFDKVVTPSDVGKLNRLVIPKQYAEKYFPLDSSNQKGLLLTFEDRDGKMWRFRYSYWNSSQSYVMTKGWSRFVKEKKLDAGDIVSFHRGRHQLYRHKLYIDWRPRSHSQSQSQTQHPHHHHHLIQPHMMITGLPNFYLPNHHHSYTSSQYSQLLNYPATAAIHPPPYPHQYYNNNFYTTSTALHQHHHHPPAEHLNNMNPLYYLPSSPITPTTTSGGGGVHQHLQGQGQQQDQRNVNAPMNMIIDSVPVAHHHRGTNDTNSSGKRRLRLFGVNMECESTSSSANSAAAAAAPPQHVAAATMSGGTSGLFDTQYRRQQ